MAATDFDSEIKQLQATMKTIGSVLDVDDMRREIKDLGEQVAAPDLWDDQANAQKVTGKLSHLQGTLDRFESLSDRIEDLGAMVELGREESDADTMAEAEAELLKLHKSVEALEVRTLLNGEYDVREALVTIRSGAGGVDAAVPGRRGGRAGRLGLRLPPARDPVGQGAVVAVSVAASHRTIMPPIRTCVRRPRTGTRSRRHRVRGMNGAPYRGVTS